MQLSQFELLRLMLRALDVDLTLGKESERYSEEISDQLLGEILEERGGVV